MAMRAAFRVLVAACSLAGGALAHASEAGEDAPDAARQRELVRVVRQDCGSCHGMHLTGGLGPALGAQRLSEWPLESVVATIEHGRPGTPMPGWAPLLSRGDVTWIARQLQRGFPELPR